ncbi:MAG: hypothetical protein BWY57_01793 [Betaproteobacteria bacterium ADurb.Bin341]|nr:MAG: hypothetical protein BWY57_01793 [Betaproteobacteria bacterium ADurb.Bin341]
MSRNRTLVAAAVFICGAVSAQPVGGAVRTGEYRTRFGEPPRTAACGWPFRHLLPLTSADRPAAPALSRPPPAPSPWVPLPRTPRILNRSRGKGPLSIRLLIAGVSSAGLRPPARKRRGLRQGGLATAHSIAPPSRDGRGTSGPLKPSAPPGWAAPRCALPLGRRPPPPTPRTKNCLRQL